MRKPMPQGARARLLAGCALGACLAVLPSAATAQALQGTPTTVVGSEPTFNTAPNYTQVQIRSAETVINWRPFDNAAAGTIDFLPAGATAEFTEPSGTFGYTVLNRILPVDVSGLPTSRPVALNGTVIGQSGNSPGGNIWFYSPTGIIAGPTAIFNVGRRILTTNDISFVPSGATPGSIYGPGGLVQFRGPADSTGFVEVQPGAQLNAIGLSNAYVALVAPRVVQGGQVSANGQIAYIAAEQVDMTINAGLFDFTLLLGTTDANGIVHTGMTTGPASTSAADLQRISMVALPKNDALTMLLSGSIGYAPAAIATNEGSTVVLAAGFTTDDPAVVPANRLGSISIGDATFANRLVGYATDAIDVAPSTATSFDGATALYAVNSIDVTASAATSITAASTLTLRSGGPGTGGTINLSALSGGQVTAAGGFLGAPPVRQFASRLRLAPAANRRRKSSARIAKLDARLAALWAPNGSLPARHVACRPWNPEQPNKSLSCLRNLALQGVANSLLHHLVHRDRGNDVHAGLGQDAPRFFLIRSGQAHDDRVLDLALLHCFHDSARHVVAAGDPTEDVEDDRANISIGDDDLH